MFYASQNLVPRLCEIMFYYLFKWMFWEKNFVGDVTIRRIIYSEGLLRI